jgi:hypothetical protein
VRSFFEHAILGIVYEYVILTDILQKTIFLFLIVFSSSAASVLKSFHTGMPYYQKGKVSDSGYLHNPQVSFLAASNGVSLLKRVELFLL